MVYGVEQTDHCLGFLEGGTVGFHLFCFFVINPVQFFIGKFSNGIGHVRYEM